MSKIFLAGNWKMNKSLEEGQAFIRALQEDRWSTDLQVGIFVPAVYGYPLASLKNEALILGLQNAHFEDGGAYTGEWSMKMVKDIGLSWVILGHSERRQYFGETDQTVNLKIKKALSEGIQVIFCCGETLEERKQEKQKEILKRQIVEGLSQIEEKDLSHITIAYEPIWAIGTGVNAKDEDAEEMCAYIRFLLTAQYGEKAAKEVCLQYGGSVKPANIKGLLQMPNINGALIGGASLDVDSFKEMIRIGGDLVGQ